MWNAFVALSWPAAVGITFAALSLVSLGSTALGFAIERSPWGRGHRVFDVPLDPGQYAREARGYLGFLVLHALGFPSLVAAGAIAGGASGAGAFALTFFVTYLCFESSYFLLHLFMHRPAFLWTHRFHHLSRVTTPLTGLSVHPAEAVGWVFCLSLGPVLLSLFGPIHFGAWLAYLVYNFAGNIVGHANAEFFPQAWFRNRVFSTFAQPVICHALHHARWTGHYGFASLKYDRMVGSEFSDWTILHERVAAGHPMKSLRETGHSAGRQPA
jgi:sterol desaturase/sphingolipid hydroxylase (fatty acid hydroxylase superfamily)